MLLNSKPQEPFPGSARTTQQTQEDFTHRCRTQSIQSFQLGGPEKTI